MYMYELVLNCQHSVNHNKVVKFFSVTVIIIILVTINVMWS